MPVIRRCQPAVHAGGRAHAHGDEGPPRGAVCRRAWTEHQARSPIAPIRRSGSAADWAERQSDMLERPRRCHAFIRILIRPGRCTTFGYERKVWTVPVAAPRCRGHRSPRSTCGRGTAMMSTGLWASRAASAGALAVGNGLGYRARPDVCQDWVGDPVIMHRAEPQAQTPATAACPGRVVGLHLGAE
jgi:hypothetical protein